jgi:hypothetical protein
MWQVLGGDLQAEFGHQLRDVATSALAAGVLPVFQCVVPVAAPTESVGRKIRAYVLDRSGGPVGLRASPQGWRVPHDLRGTIELQYVRPATWPIALAGCGSGVA